MFIEEIEEKERTLGDKLKEFGKKLGKLCFKMAVRSTAWKIPS